MQKLFIHAAMNRESLEKKWVLQDRLTKDGKVTAALDWAAKKFILYWNQFAEKVS